MANEIVEGIASTVADEAATEASSGGFFTEDFLGFLSEKGTDILLSFLGGLALLFIGIKISKKIVKIIDKSKRVQKIEPSVRTFLRSALTVLLYAAVISSTAIIWGIPTTSFMTVFASAGVAVGLALQGSLSNLAGGIMILLFKPFKVGDFIEGASCTGVVQEITVMYTKLLTVDNKVVVIPNGTLTGSNVTDYSTMPLRRVDLMISASYSDDIEKVKELRKLIDETGSKALIEVDGGVTFETAPRLVKAGVDVLVSGNTIFSSPDPEKAIMELKKL